MPTASTALRKYIERTDGPPIPAVAIQLDFPEGLLFTYQKWGGSQTAKPGDWLVLKQGDTYTIDAESFERTYTQPEPGPIWFKTAPVWAREASTDGVIPTKERFNPLSGWGLARVQQRGWLRRLCADGRNVRQQI